MMYEVFIEGEKVDLDYGTDVPLTFQVFDVNSITNVMSNYTKTISIPKTPKNNEILGFPDTFESASRKIYSKLKVMVLKNGVEIISSRGLCFVVSVSNRYELNIFYGNYAFFSDIENKSLTDIDTSDIDHNWNYAAINESSIGVNRFTKNYVYPIMEWGRGLLCFEDSATINLEMLLPVVSIRYLIDKIVAEAGYIYTDENNVLTFFDDKYVSLVDTLGDDTDSYQISQANAYSTIGVWSEITLYPIVSPDKRFGALYFPTISVYNYFNQMQNKLFLDSDPYYFTAYRVGCNCKLNGYASFKVAALPYVGDKPDVIIRFGLASCDGSPVARDENGDAIENYYFIVSEDVDIVSNLETEIDVSINLDGNYQAGEFLCIVAEISTWDPSVSPIAIDIKDMTFNFYEDPVVENVAENFGYGYHINFARNLPKMSQVDFLKELMVLGGMVMTSNYYDKIIYFNAFNDLYKNLPAAKDWSDKVHFDDAQMSIRFVPESYYKRNHFKYLELPTEGGASKEIGSGYFDIDNQMLESSDSYFTSKFSASDYFTASNKLKVLQVNAMDVTYKGTGVTPRIMILKEVDDLKLPFNTVTEATSGIITEAIFGVFVSQDYLKYDYGTDDLDFQNIINDKYSNLITLLNNFKAPTLPVKLNDADVANFNHLIPIWISAYNSYFYVNKIIDYTDGLTLVELIKIY